MLHLSLNNLKIFFILYKPLSMHILFHESADKMQRKMKSKVSEASTARLLVGTELFIRTRRRLIPKRGQIKMRIAAKAFHSLSAIISSTSSQRTSNPTCKSRCMS
nr:hypothetical protein EUGRSUZ_D01825 [Ipomoea trifida]